MQMFLYVYIFFYISTKQIYIYTFLKRSPRCLPKHFREITWGELSRASKVSGSPLLVMWRLVEKLGSLGYSRGSRGKPIRILRSPE